MTRPRTRTLAAVPLAAWLLALGPEPRFVSVEEGRFVEYEGVSRGLAWGDMDGDGDPDLLVTHPLYNGPEQTNQLYRNDDGTLTHVDSEVDRIGAGGWEGAAWIDLDRDGDLDLHVVGRNGAGSALLGNRPSGLFLRQDDPFGGRIESASMTCWADADLDGWLDAFAVGYRSQGNRLFRNRGDGSMEEVALPPEGEGRRVGAGMRVGRPGRRPPPRAGDRQHAAAQRSPQKSRPDGAGRRHHLAPP